MTDSVSADNQAKKQAIKWEQKVSKTCLIMSTLFLSSYLPSCKLIYITNLTSSCSCHFLHWARGEMGPYVYAWCFENIRKAIFKLLLCCRNYPSGRIPRVSPASNQEGPLLPYRSGDALFISPSAIEFLTIKKISKHGDTCQVAGDIPGSSLFLCAENAE
ncbi:hypothetical protein P5673_006078 [Acropora cervicornis]|uniref:Uncharacterized protein n=1 Tax=Acropora cervicornis TaxID=6130 RepID=A0AAD9QY10_ACRCE|nr:hypothetical protein P5673_006078 [Acropora cervicornis]